MSKRRVYKLASNPLTVEAERPGKAFRYLQAHVEGADMNDLQVATDYGYVSVQSVKSEDGGVDDKTPLCGLSTMLASSNRDAPVSRARVEYLNKSLFRL